MGNQFYVRLLLALIASVLTFSVAESANIKDVLNGITARNMSPPRQQANRLPRTQTAYKPPNLRRKQPLLQINKTVDGVTQTTTYTYNTDGIRTSKTVDGVTTRYLIDSNREYPVVIAEFDEQGNTLAEYTYGDSHIPISQTQFDTGKELHYQNDGLGSVRSITDENGVQVASYSYDAFGNPIEDDSTVRNTVRYAGEHLDAESGLYYLRNRYMAPSIGRFTQMDSWQGRNSSPITQHKYIYANADPVNGTDPSGNFTLNQQITGMGVLGILAIGASQVSYQSSSSFGSTPRNSTNLGVSELMAMSPSQGVRLAVLFGAISSDDEESCKAEWEDAIKQCEDFLDWGDPPRGVTGNYTNPKECARGLVSERCGGNRVQ